MKHFASIMTALLLIVPAVAVSQASETADEIKQLREKLERLEQKVEEDERRRGEETKEFHRKTETLAEELEKRRLEGVIPPLAELKGQYGLGPAASKVYAIGRGLSIGGYGEVNYRKFVSDIGTNKDQSDFVRFVTYVGYKFNDWIILNSELEWEHGTSSSTKSAGSGDISVEIAYLDFFLSKQFNIRAGMVLTPLGFLNEMHEPVTFHGVQRPDVETQIIPTTLRENGIGVFGEILPGLQYRTYAIGGFNAKGFSKSNLRDARQKGNRALMEDVAWTARLDYEPTPGVFLGGSVLLGNAGQNQTFAGKKVPAFTSLWDLHAQFRSKGLELRGLGAWGRIGNAGALTVDAVSGSRPVPEEIYGWYLEAAYDILPLVKPGTAHYLAPFFRFERYNTQAEVPKGFSPDRTRDVKLYTAGLTYKPIVNVAIKVDYRNYELKRGSRADEVAFGLGFSF